MIREDLAVRSRSIQLTWEYINVDRLENKAKRDKGDRIVVRVDQNVNLIRASWSWSRGRFVADDEALKFPFLLVSHPNDGGIVDIPTQRFIVEAIRVGHLGDEPIWESSSSHERKSSKIG